MLCHIAIEFVHHLLIECPFVVQIWNYFRHLFGLVPSPCLIKDLWVPWKSNITPSLRLIWDLLARAITWNIWMEKMHTFSHFKLLSPISIMMKIDHLLLLWLTTMEDSKKAKLEDAIKSVRRSLKFLTFRAKMTAPRE